MKTEISANTQAILLLTAQLASREKTPLVTTARYRKLANLLFEASLEPADFLGMRSSEAIEVCREVLVRMTLRFCWREGFSWDRR